MPYQHREEVSSNLKGDLVNKSPYEIRMEILNLAHEIVRANTEHERDLLRLEMGDKTALKKFLSDGVKVAPKIDEEEILRVARKLSNFVSNYTK